MDLEGADDADTVPAADLLGVIRVDGLEPAKEGVETFFRRLGLEGRPHGRIASGAGEQPVDEGLDVKPGAAGHDREPSPRGDPAGGIERVPDEVGGRVLDLGPDDVDEVMRDAPPGFGPRLVGADVETAVDLDGVAADDLSAEAQGQIDGDAALADGRRSEDDDEDGGFRFQFR